MSREADSSTSGLCLCAASVRLADTRKRTLVQLSSLCLLSLRTLSVNAAEASSAALDIGTGFRLQRTSA